MWIVFSVLLFTVLAWVLTSPGTVSNITFQKNPNGSLLVQWQWVNSFWTSQVNPTFALNIYRLTDCDMTGAKKILYKSITTKARQAVIGIVSTEDSNSNASGYNNNNVVTLDPTFPLFTGEGIYVDVRVASWFHPSIATNNVYYPICSPTNQPSSTMNVANATSTCSQLPYAFAADLNNASQVWSTDPTGKTGPTQMWAALESENGALLSTTFQPFAKAANQSAFIAGAVPSTCSNGSSPSTCPTVACKGVTTAYPSQIVWKSTANTIQPVANSIATIPYDPTLPNANSLAATQGKSACLAHPGCVGLSINPTQKVIALACSRQHLTPSIGTWYAIQDTISHPDTC